MLKNKKEELLEERKKIGENGNVFIEFLTS
jgi:hypothetical protein